MKLLFIKTGSYLFLRKGKVVFLEWYGAQLQWVTEILSDDH